jgi:hypothetical protein
VDGEARWAPGKRTLTEGIQLKAAGDANPGTAPVDAWSRATSGPATEVPYRAEMEQSFGHSFGNVQAHLGGPGASEGLGLLGAHAAAHGNAVAFRDSSPSRGLVAHELAHVVQQSHGGSGVQAKSVGAAGGSAEHRADAAADAVVRGEPVPDVGTADSDVVHLAVDTYGGSWNAPTYTPTNIGAGVGKRVGAHIHLNFTPTELVTAPANGIGLIQTVRTLFSTSAGGAVNSQSLINPNKRATATADGTAVDPDDGSANPLYAAAAQSAPAHASASLTDVGTTPAFGAHGHRIKKPDGTFDTKDAELDDPPTRQLAFVGQEWNAKFEVAALVLQGPLTNTYLGAVEWGYKVDAAGTATTDPAALRVVSMGAPSVGFNSAATSWNNAKIHDPDGTEQDTVNILLSTVHPVDPASLNDQQLRQRIRELADRLMTMDRTSVDYQQVRFESRGLAKEAVRRGATAADSGHTLRARAGDSLWQIAERELGAGIKWTQIFALNRTEILDPDRIAAGQKLKMPVPYRPAGP